MERNKHILESANAAVSNGDNEGFLSYCTEDTVWNFVGEQVLTGKEAVRRYMAETYLEPPKFEVEHLVGDGDFVTAIGKISLNDSSGKSVSYNYCDVWRFRDGQLHELKAFVIKKKSLPEQSDNKEVKTVIGSGFSYDEAKHPTDETQPASQVDDEEIVELPDLGKPNRP